MHWESDTDGMEWPVNLIFLTNQSILDLKTYSVFLFLFILFYFNLFFKRFLVI